MASEAHGQGKRIASSAQHWVWRLYYGIPSQVRVAGLHFDQFLRNLRRRFPLVMLQAQVGSAGQKASVVIAGAQPWAEYLPRALLEGPFERRQLGSVPLWQLPRTLRARAPCVSLVIARVDRIAARLLFGPSYLRVPDLVDLRLDIPQDLGSLYSGRKWSSLRNNIKRAHRNGVTCQIAHDEADLTHFYHRFYIPSIRQRFEAFAWPHSLSFLRGHFLQGGIVWALRCGRQVAGCVYGWDDAVPTAMALGTLNGDYTMVELGAYTAIFRALIEHAHGLGCAEINFGGSRPLLTHGSLRAKRKWGMRVAERRRSPVLLLHWESLDHCVLDMLTRSGLIFEQQGHLSAVNVLDAESRATADDVTSAHRFLRMPGLATLYLCSRSGFEAGVDSPLGTRLIDLAALGDASLLNVLVSASTGDQTEEERC
jgi:hypothetical protein